MHIYRPLRSGGGVSIFYPRFSWILHQGRLVSPKTTQLNLFSSKLTKINWERTEMSLLGWSIALSIVISICLMATCQKFWLELNPKKKYVSCFGDYNISLLNYDTQGPTQEFADLMYSHSLFPCITKPTCVTAKSASLIDNIFCNSDVNNDNVFNGILYTDISDHFPIFHIDNSCATKTPCPYLKKRVFFRVKYWTILFRSTKQKLVWFVIMQWTGLGVYSVFEFHNGIIWYLFPT